MAPISNWFKVPCSSWEVLAVFGDISIADNIYIVTGYTDMRKSIDGLCAIILNQMQTEPDNHAIYLFFAAKDVTG